MKRTIFLFIFLLTGFFTLNANAFSVRAEVEINPVLVNAYVVNIWGSPIVCSGRVVGVTYSGTYLFAYLNSVVIYPGQYGFMQAYTNPHNPFINAFDSVDCRWF